MVGALKRKHRVIHFADVSYFLELIEEPLTVGIEARDRKVKWKEVLSLRAVHTLAFFILVYCGVEFTLGGVYVAPRPLGLI